MSDKIIRVETFPAHVLLTTAATLPSFSRLYSGTAQQKAGADDWLGRDPCNRTKVVACA